MALSRIAPVDRRISALKKIVVPLVVLAWLLLASCGDRREKPPSTDGPRPSTLSVKTIGESVEGRDIESVSLGTGEATILVIGGLHTGDEIASAKLAEQLARYVGEHDTEIPEGLRVVFIPLVNPDGYAAGTRLNANGVDLNRNWLTDDWVAETTHGTEPVSGGTEPLSEPETRALHDAIDEVKPLVVITLHCCGALVEPNEAKYAVPLASAYAKGSGYQFIAKWTAYEITGELIESMNNLKVAAFDVELRDGASAEELFEKNLAGLRAVVKAVVESGAG